MSNVTSKNLPHLPQEEAKESVHLAAMRIEFKSDIGLAVMMFPPMA